MKREDAIPYVGHHVDDAASNDPKEITGNTRLIGWSCGFEPMFVAVHSYLPDIKVDSDEAVELAIDYLEEINWFSDEPRQPNYIL